MSEDENPPPLENITEGSSALGWSGQPPIGQFIVPRLQIGERIDDWEPLFRAAVTSLLLRQDGLKLAIGLLPAYLTRRPAEVELAKEVINTETLDEAFALLRTLDDPVDTYMVMQKTLSVRLAERSENR